MNQKMSPTFGHSSNLLYYCSDVRMFIKYQTYMDSLAVGYGVSDTQTATRFLYLSKILPNH
jgi:hypothetical protein